MTEIATRTVPIVTHWTRLASKHLAGRKIVRVRYMSNSELRSLDWHRTAIVLELDDGHLLWPAKDAEGNDAGALFSTYRSAKTIPPL